MKQASLIVGHVQQASVQLCLLRRALRIQINMRDARVDLLAVIASEDHVSFCQHLVGRVIAAERNSGLIR